MSKTFVLGIDCSHHNGAINWLAVKRAGYKFAIVKATEGASFRDDRMEANVMGAYAAGLQVGVYHFVDPMSQAADQADHFLETIRPVREMLTIKPVLDAEWRYDRQKREQWGQISLETRIGKLLKLNDLIRAETGTPCKLYSSPAFIRDLLHSDKRLTAMGLWLAQYRPTMNVKPKAPEPWKAIGWDIWQWCEHGRIPGCSGEFDLNVWTVPR